ncbi:MAG: prephenate dehydrogenase/arogenate dehydrogenase family protein [Thermodesulfobacteriota bacterium]|nr:prephenate dehydrogenase/arogenate dehydrogenase family protein [Thermodesulfobacteriota bacterium]
MGVTDKFTRPDVGIVGGTGSMGSWFAGLLERFGSKVFRVGRKTDLTPYDAARRCDVVVISVPIADTVKVIQELGPLVPEDSLLMDLTSIKKVPVETMLKYSSAQVVGAHPLFGPDMAANSELTVAVCPGRGNSGLEWLSGIIRDAGLAVSVISPEKHDQIMGLVQGVNHFSTLAMALSVSRSGLDLDEIINCSTQTFKERLGRIRSIIGQPAGLFGSLLMDNPEAVGFVDEYVKAAGELSGITRGKDREAFKEVFEMLKRFFNR